MEKKRYHISDVVSDDFLRFPLVLLANPNYRELSLEAKFVYALLLNRLTLSQRNGWINGEGEVYLIFTRDEVAATLNISYKKAIAAFKELIAANLLEETRQGRGYPNLLYVLMAEVKDKDAAEFSAAFDGSPEDESPETGYVTSDQNRPADPAHQDLSKQQFKTSNTGTSRPVRPACQDLPKQQASKNNIKKTEMTETEISLSNHPARSADEELETILRNCELELFSESIQDMFRAAIERMFFSTELHIGTAVLPQARVRSFLHLLSADILIATLEIMKKNENKVQKPTAYLMSVIYNLICEEQSDLILSLPEEYQTGGEFYAVDTPSKSVDRTP